jgi:hypothetical protein
VGCYTISIPSCNHMVLCQQLQGSGHPEWAGCPVDGRPQPAGLTHKVHGSHPSYGAFLRRARQLLRMLCVQSVRSPGRPYAGRGLPRALVACQATLEVEADARTRLRGRSACAQIHCTFQSPRVCRYCHSEVGPPLVSGRIRVTVGSMLQLAHTAEARQRAVQRYGAHYIYSPDL